MDLVELERVLKQRHANPPPGSYSARLLADPALAARKINEEAYELCAELTRPEVDAARTAEEAADLIFHVLAGLVGAGVAFSDVLDVLAARRRGSASGGQATPEAAGEVA